MAAQPSNRAHTPLTADESGTHRGPTGRPKRASATEEVTDKSDRPGRNARTSHPAAAGPVRIQLDQATTAAGQVSLDGRIRLTEYCHNVQSVLVAIYGEGGRVLEIAATVLPDARPPSCP